METFQHILVFIAVALAVTYLLKKFVLPKTASQQTKGAKACGQKDCGCH